MNDSGGRLRIPGATYRLQFNRDFTFKMAQDLIGYLDDLGITDCYASPIFLAPPDSNHGYDVCDYNRLNPVLGSEQDWSDFTGALRSRGMGLLLDFVPNHMGTNPELNPWLKDILEYGVESPYAGYFDIDWNPPDATLKNRLLLPILEDHLEEVLELGLVAPLFENGRLVLQYRNVKLPVNPRSYRRVLELVAKAVPLSLQEKINESLKLLPDISQPVDRSNMEQVWRGLASAQIVKSIADGIASLVDMSFIRGLLSEQAYQLAFWRTGTRSANYRRFFDVDGLIGMRMERADVFDTAHALLLECVRAGQVTGLRLDHIDGLADPNGYLNRLQTQLMARGESEVATHNRAFYVLVEKITMAREQLRNDWPVFGTTGYEFANSVTGLLIDSSQEKTMTDIYAGFTGDEAEFVHIVESSKKVVLNLGMSKEISMLGRLLAACAQMLADTRNLVASELAAAIKVMMISFPVYRTYMVPGKVIHPDDAKVLEQTFKSVQVGNQRVDPRAFDFLRRILLREETGISDFDRLADEFRCRFQQITGPIMAKSYEDTAFFIFNRLIALNEVGGNPGGFGIEPRQFHEANLRRAISHPHTMLATSTHDTKLSEDVRARLAVLSEVPSQWEGFLRQAEVANAPHKTVVNDQAAPDANEEYLFYQILLGIWPLCGFTPESRKDYVERVQRQMLKASREAKIHTRWDEQNKEWETALNRFVDGVISGPSPEFTRIFLPLAQLVAEAGMVNSLSQTLLKLTVPGVPDLYQGNEIWQFILTDPDNRRSIDFTRRRQMAALLGKETPGKLLADWRTGGIKMLLIRTVLRFRRDHPDLFEKGKCVPVECLGQHANNCVAFARVMDTESVVVLAPRLTTSLGLPPVGDCWGATKVRLSDFGAAGFKDLFTGEKHQGNEVPLSQIFRTLPFAVLKTGSADPAR